MQVRRSTNSVSNGLWKSSASIVRAQLSPFISFFPGGPLPTSRPRTCDPSWTSCNGEYPHPYMNSTIFHSPASSPCGWIVSKRAAVIMLIQKRFHSFYQPPNKSRPGCVNEFLISSKLIHRLLHSPIRRASWEKSVSFTTLSFGCTSQRGTVVLHTIYLFTSLSSVSFFLSLHSVIFGRKTGRGNNQEISKKALTHLGVPAARLLVHLPESQTANPRDSRADPALCRLFSQISNYLQRFSAMSVISELFPLSFFRQLPGVLL